MYSQAEVRNKPKWRRLILAASLLISPVAGVLMTSGAASAIVETQDATATITFECGKNGPFVSVSIEGGTGSEKYYVEVVGEDLRYPEEGGKSAGHLKNRALFEGELTSGTKYTVEVYLDVEGPDLVGDDEFTFDCGGVDVSCANRSNPSITVVLPDKPGLGDPFTYMVELRNELGDLVDELDEVASSGDTVVLNSGGQGTFTVVIIRDEGDKVTSYDVTVSCPRKKPRSSTVTTTPPLPSTGSDSSTSLLILAPAMMALGGGLVLARRRMVKA